MREADRYYIDGFELTVYESCYLVEVEKTRSEPTRQEPLPLPEWVFGSRNAIWLAVENAPISVRAKDGESLKQRLFQWIASREE